MKPAVPNTRANVSPYGQNVFADAFDTMGTVDLVFDALITEMDISELRIFLSDVIFDQDKSDKGTISIPFGKNDCTVFRTMISTEDIIQEFAPALRTDTQTFQVALLT